MREVRVIRSGGPEKRMIFRRGTHAEKDGDQRRGRGSKAEGLRENWDWKGGGSEEEKLREGRGLE